jgi:hypothetical protein
VGFEPTISVLERAKTVRALDRAATAIGNPCLVTGFVHVVYMRLYNWYKIDFP